VVASAIGVSKMFWRISSLMAATGLSGLLVRIEMVRSRCALPPGLVVVIVQCL